MILIRSLVFQALFYTSTLLLMVLSLPVFVLPARWGWPVVPLWALALMGVAILIVLCLLVYCVMKMQAAKKRKDRGLEDIQTEFQTETWRKLN